VNGGKKEIRTMMPQPLREARNDEARPVDVGVVFGLGPTPSGAEDIRERAFFWGLR